VYDYSQGANIFSFLTMAFGAKTNDEEERKACSMAVSIDSVHET
jgi:hypothetical protein